MNRDSLLTVYNRLTGLVEKLPGGLQKPILRELTPIRELFLEQRPARLLLVGNEAPTPQQVLSMLGAEDHFKTGGSDNGWRSYLAAGRGEIQILDARQNVPEEFIAAGITRHSPDVVIFLGAEESSEADWKKDIARTLSVEAPVIGLAQESAFRLQARLAAEHGLSHRVPRVLTASDPACDEAICAALPLPAQLEFARATNAKRAQAHIAGSLLKSFSAVCGVIGVQPIPLADMPILTTLQTLMVGLIIHTTGRPFSARLVAEFLGALGFNIGAGLVLREGARAIVKVIPIWGNAVSGFIAGAGTYAIGKAAIAYFIEETPINETRKIFRRLLPRLGKQKSPPALPPADPSA
ncbi:MAG: hypothetical protein D4R65_09865 [Verrucomicrobiaceae bacterium]|nr:MAG: hypothetical protein D4R65_09865 [Verrucomicrobiaceae bacterium]